MGFWLLMDQTIKTSIGGKTNSVDSEIPGDLPPNTSKIKNLKKSGIPGIYAKKSFPKNPHQETLANEGNKVKEVKDSRLETETVEFGSNLNEDHDPDGKANLGESDSNNLLDLVRKRTSEINDMLNQAEEVIDEEDWIKEFGSKGNSFLDLAYRSMVETIKRQKEQQKNKESQNTFGSLGDKERRR